MKQKIINLYTFEELTEEQKEKCLDKYRDINDDLMIANDETYTQPIHDAGFLCPVIYGDLSYSQGSGACFETDNFDFNVLLKDWEHPHKNTAINLLTNYCDCRIVVKPSYSTYEHEYSRYFRAESVDIPHGYSRIEHLILSAQLYIEQLRLKLSKELTQRLYEDLEYLQSDEVVADCLISNNYYFNAETLEIEE